MTSVVSLHPQHPLEPGRYLLDQEGRLHPIRFCGFVRAVAAVRVVARVCESAVIEQPAVAAKPKRLAEDPPRREFAPMRPLARKPKPSTVHIPEEEKTYAAEEDDAFAEFQTRLKRVAARRGKDEVSPATAKIDGARIAAAHRAKVVVQKPKKAPTKHALSDEQCPRCGTRGTIGCDHQLPYIGDGH